MPKSRPTINHVKTKALTISFYLASWNYIRTGITCATQLAGGLLLKRLKYFEVMLTTSNSRGREKMWNLDWSVYTNKIF